MSTPTAPPRTATDWDSYYQSVPVTARLTRRYTTAVLVRAMKRYARAQAEGALAIVEIGGANSCFLDSLLREIAPRSYDVVDTNEYGLQLLAQRAGAGRPGGGPLAIPLGPALRLHQQSVLSMSLPATADVVFSVGLVEHFNPEETRAAVLAHFGALRTGGLAIITFPTPTALYRATRKFIEAIGQWKFPDERPLQAREVLAAVRERGEVLFRKTLWPLMLTQHMVVARKVR
ncbi:MAG: class I SAM-dependent methyltransferase [Bryobacteraceae bacterium]